MDSALFCHLWLWLWTLGQLSCEKFLDSLDAHLSMGYYPGFLGNCLP